LRPEESSPQSFPLVGVSVTCFPASDAVKFLNQSNKHQPQKLPFYANAPARNGKSRGKRKMRPKRTILCVDDNEQALSIRKLMLETRGYRVLACSNGQQALDAFKQGGVDLVLSDLQMPGLDGAELVNKIKELSACTPAILFSGKTRFYQKDTLADLFLPKGMYAPIELLERIRMMLVKKRGPKRLNSVEPPRMSAAS
jgi:two-component system, OmpR family, response regulator CpxR